MKEGVSVCIVNYNGVELLTKYLPEVVNIMNGCQQDNWELIFYDNGSEDNSISVVKSICPHARILSSPENFGFSISNNSAVKFAKYKYVLLLNNDVLPEKDFLAPLIETLNDPEVFAAAPKMYRLDKSIDDGIRHAEFKTGLLTPVLNINKSLQDKSNFTTFFCGGAVLLKKEIFDELGGFDTLFTPYSWEDLDLSYRSWKRGYKVVYEPKSVVYHHREGTAKKVYSLTYRKMIAWRNRFIFMWKNLSFFPWILEHIFYLPFKLIKFVLTGRGAYVLGFLWACNFLPMVIVKRIQERKYFTRTDLEIFDMMGAE